MQKYYLYDLVSHFHGNFVPLACIQAQHQARKAKNKRSNYCSDVPMSEKSTIKPSDILQARCQDIKDTGFQKSYPTLETPKLSRRDEAPKKTDTSLEYALTHGSKIVKVLKASGLGSGS